jgi:hypothetical protein
MASNLPSIVFVREIQAISDLKRSNENTIVFASKSTRSMNSPIAKVVGVHESTGDVKISLLMDLAKQGLPQNDPISRLYLWELFLHVRPIDRSKWESTLSSRNSMYWSWVSKYFANASDWLSREYADGDVTTKEFGLSDDETMAQIHGDLIRVPDSQFAEVQLGETPADIRPHLRRIERILYVFSCLNAAYSYTQGFDSLLFPIYSIAMDAHRQLGHSDDLGEASAFYLLQNLITGTGLGDLFTMDQDFDSVASKFDLIKPMVNLADQILCEFLFKKLNVVPLQFAFPWVSVLFRDLYAIEPLLTLWDRVFLKESNVVEFAMAIAGAHLIESRDVLLTKKSFPEVMDFLAAVANCDPVAIIARAEDMWVQFVAKQ